MAKRLEVEGGIKRFIRYLTCYIPKQVADRMIFNLCEPLAAPACIYMHMYRVQYMYSTFVLIRLVKYSDVDPLQAMVPSQNIKLLTGVSPFFSSSFCLQRTEYGLILSLRQHGL